MPQRITVGSNAVEAIILEVPNYRPGYADDLQERIDKQLTEGRPFEGVVLSFSNHLKSHLLSNKHRSYGLSEPTGYAGRLGVAFHFCLCLCEGLKFIALPINDGPEIIIVHCAVSGLFKPGEVVRTEYIWD
ncbi:MAG: hypothetical protein PHS53_02385 [Candidatus Pacebacteria bacterium]|nr:hypothetical protein [Candidatus Paceibacterota bacterium]MDD5356973.1 hypothetical protein [Candidatus Paceibacterota bacterium]